MKTILLSPRFLLPVSILLGALVVGERTSDLWDTVASGKLIMHTAQAETKSEAKAETPPAAAPNPAATQTTDTPVEPTLKDAPPEPDASPAEMEVLKQLSNRREQLEKRSHDLDTRESLLKVAEQRVDQKMKEMGTLRQQLQAMVGQANGAQQAQLENLVKIYETMKPEDAAKIFDTLDMHVLLDVFQKMKPARTAPIMAKMSSERAKEVTVALTKQDQLPQVK